MMSEFLARAYLHRLRLGDSGVVGAAELIAAEVDNPALHRRIAAAAGRDVTADEAVARLRGVER